MAGNTGWLLGLVCMAVLCAVTMATADVATDPDDPKTDKNLTDDPKTDKNLTSQLDVCQYHQNGIFLVTVGHESRDSEGEKSPCDVIKPVPRKEKPLERQKKGWWWWRRRPPPNKPPYFKRCPGDIRVTARAREVDAIVRYTVTAGDKESTPTLTLNQGRRSRSHFKEGYTTVKYTAKDSKGATATCTFTVSVKVIRCPNDARLFNYPYRHQSCSGDENNLYGSVCQHSCLHGYRLKGSARVTCHSSGSWSTHFPSCLPPKGRGWNVRRSRH